MYTLLIMSQKAWNDCACLTEQVREYWKLDMLDNTASADSFGWTTNSKAKGAQASIYSQAALLHFSCCLQILPWKAITSLSSRSLQTINATVAAEQEHFVKLL